MFHEEFEACCGIILRFAVRLLGLRLDSTSSVLQAKNLSVADQSHIADLFDLLEGRCREANIPPRFQIKLLV